MAQFFNFFKSRDNDLIVNYLRVPKLLTNASTIEIQNASLELRKAAAQKFEGLPTENIVLLAKIMHKLSIEHSNYDWFVTAQSLLKAASATNVEATDALRAMHQQYNTTFADSMLGTISESVFERKLAIQHTGTPKHLKTPAPGS